jgi:hypothetical protein
MFFTTPIEAILVGNLAGFAPLIPALHALHVRDVDALIELTLDESASAALLELTSPLLIGTMRELRRISGLLRSARLV